MTGGSSRPPAGSSTGKPSAPCCDRQPCAVAADEADRPARPPAPRSGRRVARGPVPGCRRAGDDRRERAVRPASGQRADIRDERSAAEASRPTGWGDRPAGRVGARSGRARIVEPVRIGAVHEQPGSAADVDDAEESRALHRLRGDRDAGWLAARPREDARGRASARARRRRVACRSAGTASASSTMRPESSVISVSSGPRLIRNRASSAELLMNAASSPGRPSLSPRMKGVLPEPTGSRVTVGVAKWSPAQRKTRASVRLLASLSGARKYVASSSSVPSPSRSMACTASATSAGSATRPSRSALPSEDEVVEEEAALALVRLGLGERRADARA